jgi:hypothetical protein
MPVPPSRRPAKLTASSPNRYAGAATGTIGGTGVVAIGAGITGIGITGVAVTGDLILEKPALGERVVITKEQVITIPPTGPSTKKPRLRGAFS